MKNSMAFFICLIFFRSFLDLSYYLVIADNFSYVGYQLKFDLTQYIVSWVFFFLMLFFLSHRMRTILDYFFLTVVVLVWSPLTSIYGLDADRSSYALVASLVSFTLVLLLAKVSLGFSMKAGSVRHGKAIALSICMTMVGFLVFWYPFSGVTFNLDLTRVYEFRAENEQLSNYSLLAYVNSWTYKICTMFLLAFFLFKKKYVLALFCILIQVYFFAANTHKSVLFQPFVVLAIWYYFRSTSSLLIFPILACIVLLVTIGSFYFLDDIWLSAFFSNRLFFIPADLTFTYFDFFSNNVYLYWSNSFLRWYNEYPYDLGLVYLIGELKGDPNVAGNNGYVSSGFAQAGLLGVVIYSVILGVILNFLSKIKPSQIPVWFVLAVVVTPLQDLILSVDILTTLLTMGFAFSLLLLILIRGNLYEKN